MNVSSAHSARQAGALKGILITLAAVLIVGIVAWKFLLPGIVTGKIESMSGFPVAASSISVNPFGTTVVVSNLEVKNTAAFPVSDFVTVQRLDMRVKPMSLRSDKIEIPTLALELDKITIVTSKEGVTNATLFGNNMQESLGPGSDEPLPKFHIGLLELKLGSVEMIDYSKGADPVRRSVELGVSRTFTDVTDAQQVMGPIVADVLRANATGIANALSTLIPADKSEQFGAALRGLGSLLQSKGAADKEGSAAEEAEKKRVESLKDDGKP